MAPLRQSQAGKEQNEEALVSGGTGVATSMEPPLRQRRCP